MAAFTESQSSNNSKPSTEGCLPLYTSQSSNNRPQYVKTTARGGQVFRLLAVYEDGKQDYSAISNMNKTGNCVGNVTTNKSNAGHSGREKEKGRYAQLLNENRQVLYVSLTTKGKFYEIEPGIPQILQKLSNDTNKKINSECVHRITTLMSASKELPMTLRYISGPSGCANVIPEQICVNKTSIENIIIVCPIEDVEEQSPLHLRKLHLTKEMYMIKDTLGFENEQRMLANPNVQNILKYCQFNCDQFLKMVEIEVLNRSERSGSKTRGEGLKILKPLHLPKLLRREKTTISAHEKEDSIIFLSKSELESLDAKEKSQFQAQELHQQHQNTLEHSVSAGRISDKMKVFQSTKKKWFRKQNKEGLTARHSFDLSDEGKRLSMERYGDVSKLLQQRFGEQTSTDQHILELEPGGTSDIGCSDTEATLESKLNKFRKSSEKLNNSEFSHNSLQKSLSLQDMTSSNSQSKSKKRDLFTDAISEAQTDTEDVENIAPSRQMFITEKLYTEFHVKTKQHSKSSSSLHQLINFSRPQKLNESKRNQTKTHLLKTDKRTSDFNIGEPVTGRRAAGELSIIAASAASHGNSLNSQYTSLISPLTPINLLEDDLPYSNVRDSLILSSDDTSPIDGSYDAANICQALHLIDYGKENIYAEICHEASAAGGVPNSNTKDTISTVTHSTQVSYEGDEYGEYASLNYDGKTEAAAATESISGGITRVQVNSSPSLMVSYHTVYLGDEPLGKMTTQAENTTTDLSHITTVELEGNNLAELHKEHESDNIYSTLK